MDQLLKQATIVVCTVGRSEALEACLGSLHPFRSAGAQVIVVNNRPPSNALDEFCSYNRVRVVDECRRGLANARNAGIRASAGTVVAFLDDDAQADSNWLPLLLEPFEDSQVFAVAGSVRAQTLTDPVSQAFDRLYHSHLPASRLTLDARHEEVAFPLRMAMMGTGSSLAIRREAFERFGWFDGRFGRGTRIGSGEETDLLLALLLAGAKVVIEPAAGISHRHPRDWGAFRRWAFQSGCAHTAILTKYLLREPSLRGEILRYTGSRILRREKPKSAPVKVPRLPLLLGSLYGPLAFLLSK
jgi:O-antigen biosynthesis protein